METADALDNANWTSLVYGLEQGACTLMLGPNVVTGTFDGERLPVHLAMARFVIDQLGDGRRAHLDRVAIRGRSLRRPLPRGRPDPTSLGGRVLGAVRGRH